MVQIDRGVDRRQVGCSSSSSSSREFPTSTQHEGAPRVPMRLARGTSRPASLVARQATSRIAVTAEQGRQHLSTDSQEVVCQRLLLTLRGVTCVERGGWLVAVRTRWRCAHLESRCAHRPTSRPTCSLGGRKCLKTGGRSAHALP